MTIMNTLATSLEKNTPPAGVSAAVGKQTTGTVLGALANYITIYLGFYVVGEKIQEPMLFAVVSGVVMGLLLNVKLYGKVLLRYIMRKYVPQDLRDDFAAANGVINPPSGS